MPGIDPPAGGGDLSGDVTIQDTDTSQQRSENSRVEVESEAKLTEIRRRAISNMEEKGLETLFLALGMATWHATDGGRDPEAPVLLVPLTVRKSGRNGLSILERSGDAHINPVLLHALELEHGCRVDSERISQMISQLDPVNGLTNNEEDDCAAPAFDPGPLYSYLGEIARAVKGFSIRHQVIVGNFAFQKMAMVKDLDNIQPSLQPMI